MHVHNVNMTFLASALPMAHRRQSACFLVGNNALPAEVSSVVSSIAGGSIQRIFVFPVGMAYHILQLR